MVSGAGTIYLAMQPLNKFVSMSITVSTNSISSFRFYVMLVFDFDNLGGGMVDFPHLIPYRTIR